MTSWVWSVGGREKRIGRDAAPLRAPPPCVLLAVKQLETNPHLARKLPEANSKRALRQVEASSLRSPAWLR